MATVVMLGRTTSAWSLVSLPRFVGEVLQPSWACYLARVYGEPVRLRANEELDVSKFEILYLPALASCGIDVQRYLLPGLRWPYSTESSDKRCCLPRGAIRLNGALTLGPRRLFFAALPEQSWVEITHCSRGLVEAGYWAYAQRGSGVYMNTGRTIGFDQHRAALRGVLAPTGACHSTGCNDSRVGGRDDFWKTMHLLRTELEARGYDSVQFLRSEVYGLSPMELFLTGVSGTHVCGPSAGSVDSRLLLRSGFRASRVFRCDPQANCTVPQTALQPMDRG